MMIGTLIFSSHGDYDIKGVTAKYSSSSAKFRDFIRETKQRADLA